MEVFPTVSVLVITKGRRPWLAEALESIEALDYPREKLEIVVVESTDAPLAPPGVVYVPRPRTEQGYGVARNISVQASTGEILAFTDDDCIVDRRWLRELVAPMLQYPDVAGVGGAVLPRDATLLGQCEHGLGYPGGGLPYVHRAAGQLVETRQLNTVNCAYWRRTLVDAGGFNPHAARGGEDYLLAREITKRWRCLFNPRAVVYHRSRGSLPRLFARFFNFGRGQIEMLRFIDQPLHIVHDILNSSFILKYLALAVLLFLARVSPLWLVAAAATHYAYLVVSYGFIAQYIPRRAVLWVAPAVRFVSDLGMDCGRAWGLLERITRGRP